MARLREFDDVDATRAAIFDRVMDSVKQKFPIENDRYRIEIGGLHWDKKDSFSLPEQKKILLSRGNMQRKLKGEWRLVDKSTGEVVDKKAGVIAHVPYMTNRGTFVHKGNEYTIANQMRLRPAVYTRRKENGELEAHFNALPGTGKAFRVFMEPETGTFKFRVGQANIPMYPVMRSLGISDHELEQSWGKDLLNANRGVRQPQSAMPKLYQRLVGRGDPQDQQARAVGEAFQKMEMDPDVIQRNLGPWLQSAGQKEAAGPPTNVTPQVMLATTKKLIDIRKDEAEPDDRDSLANQTFHGPEDFFAERILKDAGGIARKILWNSTNKGRLSGVHSGALTPQMQGVLLNSGVGQPIEEINPVEMMDQMFRVVRLGEGGIPSVDAIPDECYDEKTEVFTDTGWRRWAEVDNTTKFACLDPDTGRMEYRRPYRIVAKEYCGELYGIRTRTLDVLVTPNHRHWVRKYRGPSSVARCGEAEWGFELASDGYRKPRQFLIASLPEDEGHTASVIFRDELSAATDYEFDLTDWAEFLGWYLAEGSIDSYTLRVRSKYQISISQDAGCNPENVERIESLLTRMGIAHSYQGHNFVFVSKQIGQYLQDLGAMHEKRVPESAFFWGAKQRKILLDTLILGYGSEKDNGVRVFHSTSKGLVSDVIRLATTLGIPSKSRKVRKHENENHRDGYSCGLLTSSTQGVTSETRYDDSYYTESYGGWVYCAEVPGEKLLVRRNGSVPTWSGNSRNVQPSQFGYIDCFRGPESERLGVDTRAAFDTYKGDDGQIYSSFRDANTGKIVQVPAKDAADKVLAFPGELAKNEKKVRAMARGRLAYVDRDEVDYELPHASGMLNASVNLVPMPSATQGNRLLMAGKMFNQALSLKTPEAPLVQSETPERGVSFENVLGRKVGAVFSQKPGRVRQVRQDKIIVDNDDGTKQVYELYDNFPLNRKSVSGNSRIVIKRGKAIYVCRIQDYEYEVGDLVQSIDENTGFSAWMPVTGYEKLACNKQLYRVGYASGRTVTVTEDHSLITMGASGKLVPVLPCDVEEGITRSPVARIPSAVCAAEIGCSRATVAGLYLAEGHIPPSQPNLLCIAVTGANRVKEVLKLLRSLDLDYAPFQNAGNVCVTDHELTSWLREEFGEYSRGKFISNACFNWSEEEREALIAGYMGGDGCLHADSNGALQLYAFSTSSELRDGLVELLSSLGVFSTMQFLGLQHANHRWRDAYGFRVLTSHVSKLRKWFFYQDRQEKLEAMLKEEYRASPFEIVPVVRTRAERKKLYAEFSDRPPHFVYKSAHFGYVAKWRLSACSGQYGQWARGDVLWDMITSVEPAPAEEFVYDLCVQGSEAFCVNGGLLVHNTYIHNTPAVKAGDRVGPDQILARSNFTDDKGDLALGSNLRVAMTPYKGMTYEDAYVMSESAAKKLSSEHMYTPELEFEKDTKAGYNNYVSKFPTKYGKEQLKTIGEDGVVKPGTKVKKGDPLILATGKVPRKAAGQWTQIARKAGKELRDRAVEWEHDFEGLVTDVVPGKDGVQVAVRAYVPLQEGDKISGRYGDKGTIAKVIPDDQMPKDSQDRPFELLQNPATLPSRLNPAQVFEMQLAKIARKTGKPIKMSPFMDESLVDYVQRGLKKHGMTDTEDLSDPEMAARKIKDVLTGEKFVMKLHHTSESKWGARETGGYTSEGMPATGGKEGAKTLANLGMNALLSHGACFLGATNVLTEDGWMEISKIVRNRLPVSVASVNERTGEIEYKRVTDWFCRSVPESELLKVETYARTGNSGIRGSHRALRCTRGHEFLVPEGRTQAAYLRPGDILLTPGTYAEPWQYKMFLGGLMGHAYIAGGKDKAGGFAVCHGHKQRFYLNWKYDLLSNFGVSRPKKQKLGKEGFAKKPTSRFTLRNHPVFDRLRAMFYPEGKKVAPKGVVKEMGLRGIAIWFCDDGGCVRRKDLSKKATAFRFHTNSFSIEEVERLAIELKDYTGLDWSVYLQNGKHPILTLGSGGRGGTQLRQWAEMMAPYVPVEFSYKLGGWAEATGVAWENCTPPCGEHAEPCLVKSVEPYALAPHEDSLVYNITVEDNHTYIVHGVGVGNTEVLRDTKLVRGQKNDDFWRSFKLGYPPPTPDIPTVYKKFITHLRGAGINVHKDGDRMNILAMTDKDVDRLSSGRVRSPETVGAKDLQPIEGGLFDRGLTGGHGGNKWSHIELAEPMPSPVMEEPIRRLLDLTKKEYEAVLRGTKELHGMAGGQAIQEALKRINVDDALERARMEIRGKTGSGRSDAIKKLRYLEMTKKNELNPGEFVISKVPVIPPNYRPISKLKDGMQVSSDANYLYQDLLFSDDAYREMKKEMGRENAGAERLNAYKALKAVTGLGDPVHPKLQEKNVGGLLKHVFGKNSPKCYDDATEVLTKEGWVPWPEYDGSVPVATVNLECGSFQWQKPDKVIHVEYKGKMVHTVKRTIDLLVTPSHDHVVSIRRGRGSASRFEPYTKVEASELVGRTKRVRYLTAAQQYDGSTPDVLGADPEAFAEFVGWWVAEGWLHTDGGVAYVCQSPKAKFDVEAIDDTFSRLGLPYSRDQYKEGTDAEVIYWSIKSKELCSWLRENCCTKSYNKRLSAEILGWSSKYLIGLLAAYLNGDGEKRTVKIGDKQTWQNRKSIIDRCSRFNTTSCQLVDSLQELGCKIGVTIKLNRIVEFVNESEWRDQYNCSVRGFDYTVLEMPEETQYIDYDGHVHCVTVPNGTVVVRRNGKVAVSGNCGMFQRRVIGSKVDVAGRAVITPNPSLDMDQVGLPEDQAWQVYKPFIIRKLVQNGMGATQAAKQVEERGPKARDELLNEMERRPLVISRAPTLHRFGMMAAFPKLIKGHTLQVSPLVTPGFNADFDGDAMSYHVPVSDKAVDEAVDKMLPSRNLRSVREFDIHYAPRHEYQLGLYQASTKRSEKPPVRFRSIEDAVAAYKRGEIDLGDEVIIQETKS